MGHREDLRRVFAFQDEYLADIGEWSTDRRRQLRNQIYLLKLEHGGQGLGGTTGLNLEAFQENVRLYVACLFLVAAVLFIGVNFWALARFHDDEGRGWILELSSVTGFLCLAAAFVVSFPKWKHYFEKPKSGVNRYQTVPPA